MTVYGQQKGGGDKLLKSTFVCLCIVLSFSVSWFPFFVFIVVQLSSLKECPKRIDGEVIIGLEMVAILNSIMDPVLFVMFRKDVKKEVGRIIRRMQHSGAGVKYSSRTISSTTDDQGRLEKHGHLL